MFHECHPAGRGWLRRSRLEGWWLEEKLWNGKVGWSWSERSCCSFEYSSGWNCSEHCSRSHCWRSDRLWVVLGCWTMISVVWHGYQMNSPCQQQEIKSKEGNYFYHSCPEGEHSLWWRDLTSNAYCVYITSQLLFRLHISDLSVRATDNDNEQEQRPERSSSPKPLSMNAQRAYTLSLSSGIAFSYGRHFQTEVVSEFDMCEVTTTELGTYRTYRKPSKL